MLSFLLGFCSAFGVPTDVAVDTVKKVLAMPPQVDWVKYYRGYSGPPCGPSSQPASTRNHVPVFVIPQM